MGEIFLTFDLAGCDMKNAGSKSKNRQMRLHQL